MKIGTNDISKIYLGNNEIEKVYLGTSQVYDGGDTPTPPTPSYDEQYLTIEALTAGDLSLANAGTNVFNYSLDSGTTWNTLSTLSVNAGENVLLKSEATPNSSNGIGRIRYTGNFNVYGNIMSLVYGDNFVGQKTIANYQFKSLFNSVATLMSAENLVLPATTLTVNCYANMFENCGSLTTAPELPATTLAYSCYANMFNSCTSLTKAPSILPATTLANYCCSAMFYYCPSLTTAPELPATTLANTCYKEMFFYCENLNYIKCLATDISASDCTLDWVDGVALSGTFVKAASMNDWTTGTSGIPNGWTVQNDDGSLVDDGGGWDSPIGPGGDDQE